MSKEFSKNRQNYSELNTLYFLQCKFRKPLKFDFSLYINFKTQPNKLL